MTAEATLASLRSARGSPRAETVHRRALQSGHGRRRSTTLEDARDLCKTLRWGGLGTLDDDQSHPAPPPPFLHSASVTYHVE